MIRTPQFTDEEILHHLGRKGTEEHACLEFIYASWLPLIVDFVRRNGGSTEEAKDVFQEGIIVLYKAVQAQKFESRSSIKVYLYSICRNTWYNRLKRQKRGHLYVEKELEEPEVFSPSPLEKLLDKEKRTQMLAVLSKIGKRCKQLLDLRIFHHYSLKEIAQNLGFSSEQVAKNSHYKCKKKLRELVKSDPGVRALIAEMR